MSNQVSVAVAALMVMGALSGCASPQSMMKGSPEIDEASRLPPDAFLKCASPKIQNEYPDVSVSPTETGWRLATSQQPGGTNDLLVIEEADSGSRIRLYQRIPAFQESVREIVLECL